MSRRPQQDDKEREDEQRLPLFYRYVVDEGDMVSDIAARFGVDARYIIWNNIDSLTDADLLTPGQQLQIPSVEGIIHGVRAHETLIEIAELYDAEVADIVAFPANNLGDASTLREGMTILVPGGRIVAPPPWPPDLPTATPKPCLEYTVQAGDTLASIISRFLPDGGDYEDFATRIIDINDLGNASSLEVGQVLQIPTTVSTYAFIWPAAGQVTSWFGPVHPHGVDIGMPRGTPVVAAAAGQVTFVGGHPCCSYGYYVVIKHDQTFTTRYGQFSRFAVNLDECVEQGDLIGYSGATGDATEPHLHFELRRSRTAQNPLHYLP